MKIWHITRTLHGGAGQYALHLSDALRDRGWHSHLLTTDKGGLSGATALAFQDGGLGKFFTRGLTAGLNRLSYGPFQSGMRADRWSAEEPIQAGDIVHLHGMTGWIGFSGLSRMIPAGTKVFWTAHDLWCASGGCVVYAGCERFKSDCQNCPILPAPVKWTLPRIELERKKRFVERYKIHAIANSHWMKQQLAESRIYRHQEEIHVIPPIIHDAFMKSPERKEARRQLGLQTDKIVIAMGARAVTDQYKGILPFLEEFSRTGEVAERALILLFGDGEIPFPKNVQVREFGVVSDPSKLVRLFAAADVFVSPSRMETFGMTLVEAQACGTPALCFEVGGTPEAVWPGQVGWLAANGDYPALVHKLKALVKDISQCRATGAEARIWVRDSFSADTVAELQESIYTSIQ